MLNKSISVLMFFLASHAFGADIVVTTTEDAVKADDQCSLREAIEYINKGRPESGLNGCGGKDASQTIILSNKEYRLNSQLSISKSLNIRTQYQADLNDNVFGRNNAVLKMIGNDRILYIERSAPTTPDEKDQQVIVSINEVTFMGCDAARCKDQGGLIYNKELLNLQFSQLLNGKARQGGAIYDAGTYEADKAPASSVNIDNTIMKGNQAEQGAVIYSESPRYKVFHSVVRDNSASTNNGSLFYARDAYNEAVLKILADVYTSEISNSTIFNNNAHIVRVMDGTKINNITMILNSKGLIFDAPLGKAVVANSILAKNGDEDCKIVAGNSSEKLTNNLYSVGCAGIKSQGLGTINLIASDTAEGKCDISSNGILCPFKLYDNTTLGYFRPRLLVTDKSLSDSLIVNNGPTPNSNLTQCEVRDQRNQQREINSVELCDRGAIELIVQKMSSNLIGSDILFGGTAKMSIADLLLDGELITPDQCQTLLGNEPNGQAWQPGCMKIVQTNTPSKGRTTLSQDGDVTYIPDGNWDGSDQFNLLVVTSTTRFSDSVNPYIEIKTNIVQRPPNDFKNNKVKTSGGSVGFGILSVLLGIIGLRRYRKK